MKAHKGVNKDMAKDWTGNRSSTFVTLGANNHSKHERQKDDYYATEPLAARLLMSVEKFSPFIWECACGEGHLSKEFEKAGYTVFSTDKVNRGFGYIEDFLQASEPPSPQCDIITNPPYKYAKEFVEHALDISNKGRKVAMFLKVQFLEGKARKKLFKKYPPKTIYVSSSRLKCAMNGEFEKFHSSATAYAWFIWEKGYTGDTVVKWIN